MRMRGMEDFMPRRGKLMNIGDGGHVGVPDSCMSKILKIPAECAVNLPDKCTIYTTLIVLLNTMNYNFGGECVDLLVKSTEVCK